MSSDYENIIAALRFCATNDCSGEGEYVAGCKAPYCCTAPESCDTCNKCLQWEAADAIQALTKRVEFLKNKVIDALDALDRGADNDWARKALEEAQSGEEK